MRTTRGFIVFTAVALCLALVLPVLAQRGDDTNRKSKNGMVEGEVGGVGVTIEYGRPMVKGREIWGGLVPFGKVWRTGADEATTITFDKDVTVQGEPLAAGTYSLFTIPADGDWTIIFNNVAKQWGAFEYADGEDTLRVMATPRMSEQTEELTFSLDGDWVVLSWEKLEVPFEVKAAS